MDFPTPIASRALAQSSTGGVFVWSLILIALVVAGCAAVLRLRRWLKEDYDGPATSGIGFTLSDLRQLHREGKMTDEEFERARSKMVEAGRVMAAKMPHPLSRPQDTTDAGRARTRREPPPGSGS